MNKFGKLLLKVGLNIFNFAIFWISETKRKMFKNEIAYLYLLG